MSPQAQVAALFIERKGYAGWKASSVVKLDGLPCWYFVYHLSEGLLELEVSWNEQRLEWETLVTTFSVAD